MVDTIVMLRIAELIKGNYAHLLMLLIGTEVIITIIVHGVYYGERNQLINWKL